jgi:hypothetical protein
LSANQCLPNETKNYVPQMIAATIIAKNPEKFGFTRVPYLPPLQFDTVKVNEPTSLKAVSIAVNVPPEEISLLNPELRKGTTPPETFVLKIPKNSKELFNRNIQVARYEVPTQASAPIETASTSAWPGYPRRDTYSRREPARETYAKKEAAPRRSPEKTVSRTAKSSRHQHYQTAQAHKGKSESTRTRASSVQVASMLPTGKNSKTAKGSTPAGRDKVCKPSSEGSAKKSNQKRTKKKGSDQSSYSTGKTRPALSKSKGSNGTKLAREAKKPESGKKGRALQTAKLRASNS